MSHLMLSKKIGNRNGLRLEQNSCWYSRICALKQWNLVKIWAGEMGIAGHSPPPPPLSGPLRNNITFSFSHGRCMVIQTKVIIKEI